jgi:hypothetical protein
VFLDRSLRHVCLPRPCAMTSDLLASYIYPPWTDQSIGGRATQRSPGRLRVTC